jgi:hypothetical protein
MSLYRFRHDEGQLGSTCTADCAAAWPPLMVEGNDQLIAAESLQERLGTIPRDDGGLQVTFDGVPLYFFATDREPGDTLGHQTGEDWVWRLFLLGVVSSPPPPDLAEDDALIWQRGLEAWRKPRPLIGACVNCHSPDAFDIARVGFSDEDIMRRAVGDGLTEREGRDIVRLVALQRQRYNMTGSNAPFDPQTFRPLQPGGMPLADASVPEHERDRLFLAHLRDDHQLRVAQPARVDSVEDALNVRDEMIALDLMTVRVGILFDRFSEDPHHGTASSSFRDWIPMAPHEPLIDKSNDWFALQDTYIANPTAENLWALMSAIPTHTSTCRFLPSPDAEDCQVADDYDDNDDGSGPYIAFSTTVSEQDDPARTRGWIRAKYRSLLVLQHMMREEALRGDGLFYLPDIHPRDYSSLSDRNVAEHVRMLNTNIAFWTLAEGIGKGFGDFVGNNSNHPANWPQLPQVFLDRIDYHEVFQSELFGTGVPPRACRDRARATLSEQEIQHCYWVTQLTGLRASWFWMGLIYDPALQYAGRPTPSPEYYKQTFSSFHQLPIHGIFGIFNHVINRSYGLDTRYHVQSNNPTLYRNVPHVNERLIPREFYNAFPDVGRSGGYLIGNLQGAHREDYQSLWRNMNLTYLYLIKHDLETFKTVPNRERMQSFLDQVSDALVGRCESNSHLYCTELSSHRAATAALINEVQTLLDNAEERPDERITRGSPEAEAARVPFESRQSFGNKVAPAPIPRVP